MGDDFIVRTEQDEIELRVGQDGVFRVFILSPTDDRPPAGTYQIRHSIDDPDDGLSIGGPVTIKVKEGGHDNGIELTLDTEEAFAGVNDPSVLRRDVQIRVEAKRGSETRDTTTRFAIYREA